MLTIAIRLFGILFLLALIVAAIGVFLPRDFTIHSAIEIEAEPNEVFAMINSLPNWQQWSTWNEERVDGLTIEYGQKIEGVGAVQTWRDTRGSGKLWITASEPNRQLEYRLKFGDFPEMRNEFMLSSTPDGTLISWHSSGSLPAGPFYGYSAMLFPSQMTHQYNQSLIRLKEVLEQSPK